MNMYDALAPFYSALNGDVDYEGMADFLKKSFDRYFDGEVADVLDLGCGTGNVTLPLAARGYGMIGVDISEEMLAEARDRDEEGKVLWLCQDMRAFELYGTVEGVVCTLDGINHLTERADVEQCFSLVHNYLVPNGIFIFDFNSPYKFENVYGERDYILETDGVLCAWQNTYSREEGLCRFDISLFVEDEDGAYERYDVSECERMYSARTVVEMLQKEGFKLLALCDGYTDAPAHDKSERITVIAQAKKP